MLGASCVRPICRFCALCGSVWGAEGQEEGELLGGGVLEEAEEVIEEALAGVEADFEDMAAMEAQPGTPGVDPRSTYGAHHMAHNPGLQGQWEYQ